MLLCIWYTTSKMDPVTQPFSYILLNFSNPRYSTQNWHLDPYKMMKNINVIRCGWVNYTETISVKLKLLKQSVSRFRCRFCSFRTVDHLTVYFNVFNEILWYMANQQIHIRNRAFLHACECILACRTRFYHQYRLIPTTCDVAVCLLCCAQQYSTAPDIHGRHYSPSAIL